MDFDDVRELVRVRHELRRLRSTGERDEARALIERLRSLAERDPREAADVAAELPRWESSFGLM